MKQPVILIAEDDAPQREMLAGTLTQHDYQVLQAPGGEEALATMQREDVDLLITDLRMPGMSGLDLLKQVKQFNPLVEVIMMTAFGSVESAVDAMQEGAFTFLTKPVDISSLRAQVERALDWKLLKEENRELKARLGDLPISGIIAQSVEMREVLSLVARVAASPATVLITGESGTGKEVVSRAIHAAGNRADKPFVAVNITAIPENLLESELFGHEKGSFTGAISRHLGRFERASEGTLFIDEIGDLPMQAQVKLLRVLQEGEIERVGGSAPIPVDVRVIAATHRNLDEEIAAGNFREDLFYRLNVVRIPIPPLRNHKLDIKPLVEHFLSRFASINRKEVTGLEPPALDLLLKYWWPGNVRELENAIESAVVLCRGSLITPADLPPTLRGEGSPGFNGCFPGDDTSLPLPERVERFEKHELLKVLEEVGGNKTEASRQLGMSDKNVRDRLKRWEVK